MNKLFTLSALVVFALAHVTAQAETTEAAKNFLDVSGLKTAEEHKVWGAGMVQPKEQAQGEQQGVDSDLLITRNNCERFVFNNDWGKYSLHGLTKDPKNPRDQMDLCLKVGEMDHKMYRELLKAYLAEHPEKEPLFKDFDRDWKD